MDSIFTHLDDLIVEVRRASIGDEEAAKMLYNVDIALANLRCYLKCKINNSPY
jgi:hypothetical protein